MTEENKQKIDDLKKNNDKQQLAEIIIRLQGVLERQGEQHEAAEQEFYIKETELNKQLRTFVDTNEKLCGELDVADRKLKVVQEAIRAGLAMHYPDAPIPSSNAHAFGSEFQLGAYRDQTPQERLLLHILQEAI